MMKVEKPVRQGGGVLILFAVCLVVLFAFAGLVIDLGTTYVGKTELQNAADASALAGAKKLNGTAAGVAAALQAAKDMAVLNRYRFTKDSVTITNNDVWVGSCPKDICFTNLAVNVTTDTVAAGKYFLKVDTGRRDFDTAFMRVANISTTSARGMAVAGRFFMPVAPIAICALDEAQCPPASGECGFKPGLTYNVHDINHALAPSGVGAGDHVWLDPVATNSSECIGNVNDTRPFMCGGKIGTPVEVGGTVYTNTGVSNALLASLDSRFGDYDPEGQCDPVTAPPDKNVMGYLWEAPSGQLDASSNVKEDWFAGGPPTRQAARVTSPDGVKPIATNTDGVRWTFSRPAAPADVNPAVYPGSGTPYSSASGKYFKAPPMAGQGGRRILNMVILQCTTIGGNCRPATVKGVGEFFMTRKANAPSDKNIYLEFSRLVNPSQLPSQEVKLFR